MTVVTAAAAAEAAEALKKWDGGHALRDKSMWRGLAPSELWRSEMYMQISVI